MRRMIEVTVRHLDGVIREGRPLTRSPAVQGRLGRMYAQYLTSRVVLHDALDRMGRGDVNEVYDPVISAAKYVLTENAVEVGERAIRLTGWRGYTTVLPLERIYRAVLASVTGQTAQDILEINLGVIAMARLALADQSRRAR
jgi:alkylation response protein AidB-like acyl-CoA dehydrogenase